MGYLVLIAILSLSPVYDATTYRYFHNEDKVAHALMYALAAILFVYVTKDKVPSVMHFMFTVIWVSMYGYLMEVLQGKLDTGRLFDSYDIVANIFGALAGTMLIYGFIRSTKRKLPHI